MILLTGVTGFLGSHLLKKLLKNGYNVGVIVRKNSNFSRIDKFKNNAKLKLFYYDENIVSKQIFLKNNIEIIIHIATEYGKKNKKSQTKNIKEILNANLILPIQLIELGIEYGTTCFINTDSYFNKKKKSYSVLLNYALSKKSLLLWLKKFSKKISVVNIYLEHMYGPNDSDHKFVQNIIKKIAIEATPRVSFSNGDQKRDFIYIEDVCEAYLTLIRFSLKNKFNFENFEVGMGKSVSIKYFVRLIKSLSNSQSILGFGDIPPRKDEIMDSKADISKLKKLGWKPKIDLKDGIFKILRHYSKLNKN
jgi:nucleoside-diphosphate-sugar epimerase